MKKMLPVLLLLAACEAGPQTESALRDSNPPPAAAYTSKPENTAWKAPIDLNTPPPAARSGKHPVTLQWISWDKPGSVTVTPATGGWYTIRGGQSNAEGDYLRIDGKVRRAGAKELEFTGSVETRTSYNNNGAPCIKKGLQRFFAKGSRRYYRMQDMENCGGGNVVDYVDLYPGASSL